MSDLISRKAALDAIVNLTCYGIGEMENLCKASIADSEGWLGGILETVHELQALPSAEERTAKLEHTYQVGENWFCENCGQQLNAYSWETPQNLAELGNENAHVSEATSQNDGGTWQKTERTTKAEMVDTGKGTVVFLWKCSECGQFMHRTSWSRPVRYCNYCGARLEWE